MKNYLWVVLLVVVAAVLVAVGILRKSSGTSGRCRITVIPKETTSVYWEGVLQGARQAAEEEDVDIVWTGPDSETNRERQIQILQDAVAQNADGIVLAPNDRKALVPLVEKIHAKGIPCVIVDSAIETEKYLSFMATDNRKGGVLAAQRMGEILQGQGNVLLVEWTPNSASTEARAAGFRETLTAEFPEIKIVDAQYPNPATLARSREVVEDMLTRNAQVDGVFSVSATTSAGALLALSSPGQAERGIKMIGFDTWPAVVDGVRKGQVDSLIVQNPYRMGYEGVKAVLDKLEGKEVVKYVDTGVELVTKERLADPEIQRLLSPGL